MINVTSHSNSGSNDVISDDDSDEYDTDMSDSDDDDFQ